MRPNKMDNAVKSDSILVKKEKWLLRYNYYNKNDTTIVDSVKSYYKDTEALEFVIYNTLRPLNKNKSIGSMGFYRNGKNKYITYSYNSIIAGDTIQIYWHSNGEIERVTTYLIKGMDHPWMHHLYDINGRIIEDGMYSIYRGNQSIVPIGTWNYYDTLGDLYKTTFFHNDIFGKDYIIEKLYKNGQVISKRIYNNNILYETGEVIEYDDIP